MKKRKIEIAITAILSLIVWIYFYMNSIPLSRNETIVVVGVIFVFIFIGNFIFRKIKSRNE